MNATIITKEWVLSERLSPFELLDSLDSFLLSRVLSVNVHDAENIVFVFVKKKKDRTRSED